jgi:para-nitrobenzyl esterase
MTSKHALVSVLIALLIAACGDDNESRPAPTATATSTNTSTRTPTDLPTRTPTVMPSTATPTVTETATSTNTSEPTPTTTPDSLLVTTDLGTVRGKLVGGVRSFLGIPYAAPPVGELRWRAPAPHPGWTGVRSTTSAGNVCSQTIPVVKIPTGGEDCLFINVHTPDPPPQEPAPVMVWIHGGGFTTGDGLQYGGGTDGSVIVRNSGVVVVSFNYRLGQFGFLAHAALTTEDPEHPGSGNYGLEDQIAALQWVQRNIAAFGGDPSNVTIFGESAGGWSVCAHLASPRSAGLFQRAIVESGICIMPQSSLAAAEAQGATFAVRLGCDAAEDVLACMRAKSASDVRAALRPDPSFAFSEGEFGSWFPVLDGNVFTVQMADSFAAGNFNQVPVMVGSNRDEGTLFVMMSHNSAGRPLTAEDYPDRLSYLLRGNEELVSAVETRYALDLYPGPFEALSAAFGDGFLACPTIDTGHLLAGHVPAYLYQFEFPDAKFALPATVELGAFHSAEIQYVFGIPTKPPFTDDELALSEQMMGYWTRFARTGDPNGGGAVAWPLLDEADQHLVLDRTIAVGSHAKSEACTFWRGLDYRHAPL